MKSSINKQEEVIKLRKEGLSLRKIGEIVGISKPTVSKLIKNNYKKIDFTNVNSDIFTNLKDRDLNYFLGLLATDGSITDGRIEISLKELDIDILEKFKVFLGGKVNILPKYKKMNNKIFKSFRISFRSKEISKILFDYGITNRKTFNLKLNIDFNWDLMRGIIDGDGSFIIPTKGNKIISICSASEDFIYQISDFLNNENIKHKINKVKTCFVLNIVSQFSVIKTIDNLYKETDVFIKRKHFTAHQIRNFLEKRLSNSGNQFQESRAKLT